jgi:hypothetical protein
VTLCTHWCSPPLSPHPRNGAVESVPQVKDILENRETLALLIEHTQNTYSGLLTCSAC